MLLGKQKDYIPDDLWDFLKANPGRFMRASEISEAINRNPSTLHKFFPRLVRHGVVEKRVLECAGVWGKHKVFTYSFKGCHDGA